MSKKNKFFTGIGILASLVTILAYFGIVPGCKKIFLNDTNQSETHNVTSNNQSGGVTAHTVLFAKPPRVFNDSLKADLLKGLPKDQGRSIVISYVSNDREAFGYAQQVKSFLTEKGWTVKGPNPAIFFSKEPRSGVRVKNIQGEGNIQINVYGQG